jgi:tRNA pseudouridine55 synthase
MTVGVLSLNKPVGMTSFGAVREVRQIFGERRVGHAGTLDPNASGILPICIGRATRLVDYFHSQPKRYRCTVRFGVRSDTLDTEGELTPGSDASQLTEEAIAAHLTSFVGDIEQIPPMHSAVRHQGQHLYDIARTGATVERKPRQVTIHSAKLLQFRPGPQAEADIEVECGKGVYMRVLAADLGELVATGAILSWLERTSYGPLQIADAVTLETLKAMPDPTEALLPATVAIEFLPRLDLAPQLASKLRSGQPVWVPRLPSVTGDGACRAHGPDGGFLAIGELQGNLFRPTRVFAGV